MSNDTIKIELALNAEDAALVAASLSTTLNMMDKSIDGAIEDGAMQLAQLIRKHKKQVSSILEGIKMCSYSSDSFTPPSLDDLLREHAEAVQALDSLEEMKKGDGKEEGPKWEEAGEKVVSLLDRFKGKK